MSVKGCRVLFPRLRSLSLSRLLLVTLNRRLRIVLYSARTLVVSELWRRGEGGAEGYVVKCICTILSLVILAISVTAEADRQTL